MIALVKKHPFFNDRHISSFERLENQGYCNENYLVLADGVKYIVRKLLRTDIDRDLEWKILTLAYKNEITAEPIFYDQVEGFMVFSFLEGTHQTTLTKKHLKHLAITLKKLHNISVKLEPIPLEIQNQTEEVAHAFDTIASYPKEYVLCHNDLNPQNIFFTHEAKLIDFEYAGLNDRYFDLASVCVEYTLDETMQALFVADYFDTDYEVKKLEAYKILYRTLCEEWFLSNT